LRALRAFLRPFALDEVVTPAIAKSSMFFPDLMAAVSQRGFKPRPAHVSAGFSGLRYLGATEPLAPPRPNASYKAIAALVAPLLTGIIGSVLAAAAR
jgi:hypothetical protein